RLTLDEPFTLSCWVKREPGEGGVLFGCTDSFQRGWFWSVAYGRHYFWHRHDKDLTPWRVFNSSGIPANEVPTDEWAQMVMVYTPPATGVPPATCVRFYTNSVYTGTVLLEGTPTYAPVD